MNRKQRRTESKQGRPAQAVASPVQGVFAAAVRHHHAGRLNEAVTLYGRVLAFDGRHADSLHLLGVAAHQMKRHDLAIDMIGQAIAIDAQIASYHSSLGNALGEQGKLDEAVASYGRAIELRPAELEAHNNLGNVLGRQGRLEEASACYRRAIALQPDLAAAHYNLGNALQAQGRPEEAAACYRAAIAARPDYPEAHYNLGIVLKDQGQADEAVACYRTAIALKPDYMEAHNNLGNALKDQGHLAAAAASYRMTIALSPDYPEAHNNLGNLLREQGQLPEAVACCRRALELRPDFAEAHYNLGIALGDQQLHDAAEAAFLAALACRPDYPEAHNNLGLVLKDLRRMDEAARSLRTAIELRADFPEAHNNLGITRGEQGHFDDAVASYRRALAIRPDFPDVHKNLGMALLARGDLAAGWAEYEWRWQTPELLKERREFAQPQWRGEAAAGRTLLIHAEQGFGDTLQFCRYATLAAERGLRVILEVQRPLVRLLASVAGVDAVVACKDPLPAFDLHCPMLSMPLALGTTLETVPAPAAYLRADPAQAASWAARLAVTAQRGPRVGLVWAGNPRSDFAAHAAVDRRRSIDPAHLAPLFEVQGVAFFSLQKDIQAADHGLRLTDHMGEMGDFADTAALIANLDLVISVDTAVAHLAAALGKRVWVLERFDSCWRWLAGRRDSPWYPSLRLYRQPQPGEWAPVVAEIASDLRALVAG